MRIPGHRGGEKLRDPMQVFSREATFLCSALKRLSQCSNRKCKPIHGSLGLLIAHNTIRIVVAHALTVEGARMEMLLQLARFNFLDVFHL